MIDWIDISNIEIKQRVNSGELAANFSLDSIKYLGENICLNCKGWNGKLDQLKAKIMAQKSNKCEYRLKLKYNGILGVTNENITNSKAKMLIKNHPRKEMLFDKLPVKDESN